MKFFKENNVIQLAAVKREILTPKEYIELSRTRPSTIKSAKFILPVIGKPGFGAFDVEYHSSKLVSMK